MPDTDPGSLDRLHDIATPPPVPWWPPAPGWYVIGAIGLVLLGVGLWTAFDRRRRNRYRREALRELDRTVHGPHAGRVIAIAELLKRVALAAYPRDQVASLTGDEWLQFLDATGRTDAFTNGAGRVLGDALYRTEAPVDVPELVDAVRHWIRHHRC